MSGLRRFDVPSGELAAARAECLGCRFLLDISTRAADNKLMSASEDAGYLGRVRFSTRPKQEAQDAERECSGSRSIPRSRSRDSRRKEPPDEDSTRKVRSERGVTARTHGVDWPVREEEAEKPPPSSEASRHQHLPAPGECHELACLPLTEYHHRHQGSPCSTKRHPQTYRDQGARAGPSGLASKVARAKRAFEDPQATILRREARRRRHDKYIELAKNAAREAFLVV